MTAIRTAVLVAIVGIGGLACQRSAAIDLADVDTTPTPVGQNKSADDGRLIKATGWSIPPLPKPQKFEKISAVVDGRTIQVLYSWNEMNLVDFKEPYTAIGLPEFGRLTRVAEYLTLAKKPFCYELAAAHEPTNSNADHPAALVKVTLTDNDGDGIFETLGSKDDECPVPDWVK